MDLYRWKDSFKRDGLTTTLRLELRELLSPKVVLRKPFRWGPEVESSKEPTRIKQLVDWELVLATDYIQSSIHDMNDKRWQATLPELLDDFQQLLRDTLDLSRELGGADDHRDQSYLELPSVSPHWQNRGFRDWVMLIELLRDAWLATRSLSPARATYIAQAWFELPYPTFKRLALFAASQDNCIAPDKWLDWLLAEDAWWLWLVETQRETMRLLVLQGNHLTPSARDRLEAAILAGPPRKMFKADLEPERWQDLVNHSMWLRLAKLNASGITLGTDANNQLVTLSAAQPQWQLAANERDEFPIWMSGTGDPDYEESRHIDIAPRKRQELVKWLKQPPTKNRPFDEDTWQNTCRSHLLNSLYALYDLSQEGIWPKNRWQVALQAWSEDRVILRSWRYAAPLVQTIPDDVLREIVHSVSWWLEKVSKLIDRHEDILVDICRRVLELPLEPSTGITRNGQSIDQPVTEAINHPVGHVTQALLNLWFKRKPNDNDQLPAEIEPFFTRLCDIQIERFRHGRVLLASQLIALFRVDRPWTEKYLLPLFDWISNPIEARAAWDGFLLSPRLYWPLLKAIKSQFLETAHHYAELGESSHQFAPFLTYAALEPLDGYTSEDFRIAFEALPKEGLQDAAQALSQALEGAGEQRESYWRNRIQPFWQQIWPKSRELISNGIVEPLTRLCLAAGAEFPIALTAVQDWLLPAENPFYIVHLLYESGFCNRFPVDALRLLNIVIDNQPWGPPELGQCLDDIVKASPELLQDPQYQKVVTYSQQHGS
jgi:hypothetical protein